MESRSAKFSNISAPAGGGGAGSEEEESVFLREFSELCKSLLFMFSVSRLLLFEPVGEDGRCCLAGSLRLLFSSAIS